MGSHLDNRDETGPAAKAVGVVLAVCTAVLLVAGTSWLIVGMFGAC